MDRFTRSLQLAGASWQVLRSDRELLFLPLLSFVSMMFVLYACVVLLQVAGIRLPAGHGSDAAQAMQSNPALYAWLFVYYLVTYFVIFFFNTALVGAALERLNGGNPTVGSALALALQRIGPIFGYAVVSATVGVLMALVVERVAGILGRLVGAGLTMAWTIATFLVVPVMAAEGVGPVAAIEESAGLVRRTWGENLIGNVGISLAMSAIGGAIVFLGLACGLAADVRGYPGLAVPIMIATGLLFATSLLVGSALRGIYVAAVYYYAVAGKTPWGFDGHVLQGAFAQKGDGLAI